MLKVIMLRHNIERKEQELRALEEKDSEFSTREAELSKSIEEVSNDEEQTVVTQAVETFESERSAHSAAKSALAAEIESLRAEMKDLETKAPDLNHHEKHSERTENTMEKINIRSLPMSQRAFDAYSVETRQAMVAQPDVKEFLTQLRSMKGQQRAVTGGELTIPVVFLELISENMYRYSKLLNRVRVRTIRGQARQTVAGTVPEAVWTEMCAAINELDFQFNQVTLDGYKVAGFVPVCNAILEDSDIDMAGAVLEMISEAIGYAMDKAILYGKGAAYKMPTGIVTRLAQTSKPSDYPANAPAWVDLHTSNILSIGGSGVTGAAFWAQLMTATGAAFSTYARGDQFWAMNSKTLALLKSKVITFTATGDIAANVFGVLPIINGAVEILEFIPDGDIIGGYGDLYLLSQRSAMTLETGRQLIQDNTLFVGKQRADGAPIIAGAFVAININNTSVTTSMTFAADTANDAKLAALTLSGVTLSPTFSGDVLTYTGTTSTANAKIEATAAQAGAEIGIKYNGEPVRNGGTVAQASGAGNVYTIQVKQGNAVRVYTVTVTRS